MVDFNALKTPRVSQREESMEDLCSLITSSYSEEGIDQMISLEEELTILRQYLKLDTLTPMTIDRLYEMGILSEEAIDIVKVRKGIVSSAKSVGIHLAKFSAWVYNSLKNKSVTEKYIIKRFAKLEDALTHAPTTRAYVEDVPTYEVVQKRLVGILQVCQHLKELSSKEDTNGGYTDGMFEQIALLSNGVLKLSAPYSGTTYRNIEWQKPALTKYEVLKSPWNNSANIQKIRNLTVDAKYESLEDLAQAAKTLSKRCSQFKEGDEYSAPDYNDVANTYNAAYVINKMIRQINQAINREVNALTISYITNLIHYKTI